MRGLLTIIASIFLLTGTAFASDIVICADENDPIVPFRALDFVKSADTSHLRYQQPNVIINPIISALSRQDFPFWICDIEAGAVVDMSPEDQAKVVAADGPTRRFRCNLGNRGKIVVAVSPLGDTVQACLRNADGSYRWEFLTNVED